MMKSAELIGSAQLAEMLEGGRSLVLIDVRSAEDYGCRHIPSAVNNCVYEVAFAERMKTCAPESDCVVCVYGHSKDTHEARMAAEKLCREGYGRVLEFREGLDGWVAEGRKIETGGNPPAKPKELNGSRRINLAESRIEWTGRNLLNKHFGEIKISSGELRFEQGAVTGGEFVIDMNSMTCGDLQGNAVHDVLIAHLESDDFFDTKIYPEARFVISEALPIPGVASGARNLAIRGNLTMKGVTLPLSFKAVAGVDDEGHAAAQAVLSFDRTLWNVIYGSGKYFRNLAGHLVNDLIEVQIRIVTE